MSQAFDDLSGRRFGRLLVVALDRIDRKRRPNSKGVQCTSFYTVHCDCGSDEKIVQRSNLISGGTVSCGCHRLEQNSVRCGEKSPVFKHGYATKKNEATYEKWAWATKVRKRDQIKPNEKQQLEIVKA